MEQLQCGLYRQVVLIQRCVSITEVVHGAVCSGLCRQVVLIQRCVSITEVVHGPAYSGLCIHGSLYLGAAGTGVHPYRSLSPAVSTT